MVEQGCWVGGPGGGGVVSTTIHIGRSCTLRCLCGVWVCESILKSGRTWGRRGRGRGGTGWVWLLSGRLTNVEVTLSLPAVLEVMDKWVSNLTLWAKVQHQLEKNKVFSGPDHRKQRFDCNLFPALQTGSSCEYNPRVSMRI